MKKPLSFGLGVLSLAGLATAGWAHAFSLLGGDPETRFPSLWIFQMLLCGLLIPLIYRILRNGLGGDPFDLPRPGARGLYALLVYYALHFYLFLMIAPEGLRPAITWRMFSAGWLLMFALTSTFYWTRFAE